MATVHQILGFHKSDREVYDRVRSLAQFETMAKSILSLWLWLGTIGINVIGYLRDSRNMSMMMQFAVEAEAILSTLHEGADPPADRVSAIPLTDSLIDEPLNLRFFYFNRDLVVVGIARFMDGVGRLIFDDGLDVCYRAYEAAVRAAENGAPGVATLPVLPPELAAPYNPHLITTTPEHGRSIFIAFLKDSPITREDIVNYFTQRWGNCVHGLLLERTSAGTGPMYGRLVLTSDSYIDLVLGGQNPVKFIIEGREVWARKYN